MTSIADKEQIVDRGVPRSDNRTYALVKRAIENGWNPGGTNKVVHWRFYFFINAQYIELDLPSFTDGEVFKFKRYVSDFVFTKSFAKALVGPKRYRGLLTGAVLSNSPVDFMYKRVFGKAKNEQNVL